MKTVRWWMRGVLLLLLPGISVQAEDVVSPCAGVKQGTPLDRPYTLDFRYAPPQWRTAICLVDDWQKTLVDREGDLLYDYPGSFGGFSTRIQVGMAGGTGQWVSQELASPRVPLVTTVRRCADVVFTMTAFAVADDGVKPLQPLEAAPDGREPAGNAHTTQPRWPVYSGPARVDLLHVRVQNGGAAVCPLQPRIRIESNKDLEYNESAALAVMRGGAVAFSERPVAVGSGSAWLELDLEELPLAPGAVREFVVAVHRQAAASRWTAGEARQALAAARAYWEKLRLPYGVLEVPDPAVQALIDSSIRNIYQAREIKDGLPAFQVGPTCYRGLWVVDGAFLLESVSLLGRTEEARAGVEYLLGHQKKDGSFELIRRYWKETGIVLWVIDRHGQLTGDDGWLGQVWPRVERAVNFIIELRGRTLEAPQALYAGLVPPGFSDGGLAEVRSEYTNVYWTLVGLKSAVAMAVRLDKTAQAARWQAEFDGLWSAFRKAAARDLHTDHFGNAMLPIRMDRPLDAAPQKGQWAFCHAVYPGELFAADDAVMLGTLANLTDNEREGLVYGTGWADAGVWNYFGSFYAHAFLWLGCGQKAARTVYAFANHAAPMLVWREEQNLLGAEPHEVGDMPHNWASAEFIRCVLHLLVLERGNTLHLLEGFPPTWLDPGARTAVNGAMTRFGPVSLELKVSEDARRAELTVVPPARTPPEEVVVDLGAWALAGGQKGTVTLSGPGPFSLSLDLRPRG